MQISECFATNFTPEQEEKIKSMFKFTTVLDLKRKISELTYDELLRFVSVYTYPDKDSILQVCTQQEIDEIVLVTAETVLELAAGMKEDDIPKLKWREGKERIVEAVSEKLPELFAKIKHTGAQLEEQKRLLNALIFIRTKIERTVSALISTEEQAAALKADIIKILDEFATEVKESTLEPEYQTAVFEEMESVKKFGLEFVDVKLKEPPVKLYYFRSGTRVQVKLGWGKSSYCYSSGRGKEVRLNRGDDWEEYSHIISANYISDFLYHNKVRDEDIWVDPRSLEHYYSFNNKVSVNLTPAFVAEWWNYDCPTLYKHYPNKYRHTNMLGMTICHFSNTLIETSWTADYVDEDITEEEFKALTSGYEHTRLYKTIKSVLEARKIKTDAEKVSRIRTMVNEFDKKVQDAINSHENEVIEFLKEEFKDRVIPLSDKEKEGRKHDFRFNDNFGFDCGFIHIQTTDKEYMENRTLLRQLDKSESPWMNVHLPYFSQSTTFSMAQFRKVKEIVKRETGIELYAHSVLD